MKRNFTFALALTAAVPLGVLFTPISQTKYGEAKTQERIVKPFISSSEYRERFGHQE